MAYFNIFIDSQASDCHSLTQDKSPLISTHQKEKRTQKDKTHEPLVESTHFTTMAMTYNVHFVQYIVRLKTSNPIDT